MRMWIPIIAGGIVFAVLRTSDTGLGGIGWMVAVLGAMAIAWLSVWLYSRRGTDADDTMGSR